MNPERSAYLMPGTQSVRDQLIRMELERCSYLNTDASRIRQWRLEDARNGQPWACDDNPNAIEVSMPSKEGFR